MAIFIDTNIFVSFYNEADQNHNAAKNIISDIAAGKYGKPITSDYVFDEAVTVMLVRTKSLEHAVRLGQYILDSVQVAIVNSAILHTAWEIFRKENDEKMSFTDCTSRVFAEKFGIKNIATFDSAFKKVAGINVING